MATSENHGAEGEGGRGARLKVEVVTPTGPALSEEADEVTAPGVLGEFGVLPGHIPFLSALRAGVLTCRTGATRRLLAVGPGYLQVGAEDRVRVLTETAVTPARVDLGAARAELAAAEEQLKLGAHGADLEALQARLDWARARLALPAAPAGEGR